MGKKVGSNKVPLSQAPGKKKLLVALPGAAAAVVLWQIGIAENVTRFLALALCAYAAVGLLEIVFGESLANAARSWDQLAGWKRFLISVVVIIGALVLFISLIPVVTQWV